MSQTPLQKESAPTYSPLQWDSTPNPRPAPGESVLWTTKGGNGSPIQWNLSHEGVVTIESAVDEHGRFCAWLKVVGPGGALITASQDDPTAICRYVGVGGIYAYAGDPGRLFGASSETWTACARPSHVPPHATLRGLKYGLAYVCGPGATPDAIVLDFDHLSHLVLNPARTTTFKAATAASHPTSKPIAESAETYAYAPDGTLWKLGGDWPPAKEEALPVDFPSWKAMNDRDVALAWSPPMGQCVTCFVLNKSAFPGRAEEGITYFNLQRQEG